MPLIGVELIGSRLALYPASSRAGSCAAEDLRRLTPSQGHGRQQPRMRELRAVRRRARVRGLRDRHQGWGHGRHGLRSRPRGLAPVLLEEVREGVPRQGRGLLRPGQGGSLAAPGAATEGGEPGREASPRQGLTGQKPGRTIWLKPEEAPKETTLRAEMRRVTVQRSASQWEPAGWPSTGLTGEQPDRTTRTKSEEPLDPGEAPERGGGVQKSTQQRT